MHATVYCQFIATAKTFTTFYAPVFSHINSHKALMFTIFAGFLSVYTQIFLPCKLFDKLNCVSSMVCSFVDMQMVLPSKLPVTNGTIKWFL